MKYLCLAYGRAEDWKTLSKTEQEALLAQDDVLRNRGDLVAAVKPHVTTLRAWDGTPVTSEAPADATQLPLAGFGVIEAADLDEAIRLVTDTPCARANGRVEIRPIMAMNAVNLEGA
ncbi:hypothetical protein AUC68_04015 [Methyloceanibacter methanicus]|uniref:YCII-related domain-containing protein n=1 Tax=Methyloceanibacter methanicus TaxID=1774968 RepID=A0A1E3W059_9HYPH|nr:YciI family protein [Methyloceanibacter methanicus]ODR99188.1 hypothetical protein AUC68_04015 [Methyloceanibacter methanicus]